MLNVKNENANVRERVLTLAELEQMETVELLELLGLSLPNGNDNESIIIRAAFAAADLAAGPGAGPAAGSISLGRREMKKFIGHAIVAIMYFGLGLMIVIGMAMYS